MAGACSLTTLRRSSTRPSVSVPEKTHPPATWVTPWLNRNGIFCCERTCRGETTSMPAAKTRSQTIACTRPSAWGASAHRFEDDDVHLRPASVARLNAAIAAADAVLFSTPEYNSSIPGQLKNAVDWISRPIATNALRNKPVAVVGASTGAFGAVWAQAELRKVLAALGARVLDVELPVPHAHTRFDDGGLTDDEIRASLAEAVGSLAAGIRERESLQVVA